jgi:hypothetical protein
MSFGWLRRWLPLLLPAAEFAWLGPWVLLASAVFYPGGGYILAPLPLAVLLLGGYLLAAAPERSPLAGTRWRALLVAVLLGLWAVWATHYPMAPLWHPRWLWDLLLAAHEAFPKIAPPVLGAVAAPLVLWRGLALGGREFSHFTAERLFRRGVTWSVLFVLLYAAYRQAPLFALARPLAASYLLAFAFLSLLLLTLARLLGIWEESRGRDPRVLAFNRPWFAVALVTAALIAALGAAAGGLAGVEIWPYLAPLGRWLSPVLEAAFYILFFFASLVARLILFVISRAPLRWWRDQESLEPLNERLRSIRDLHLPPEVVSRARWGMVVLIVLLLSLGVLLAVARRRRRPLPDGDERESVWERGEFWRGLRRLFARRALRAARDDLAGAPEVIAIRVLYRRLLRLAGAAGHPRRADQTAREFQQVIAPAAGGAALQLSALTATYERVRYGEYHPPAAEVAAAREWWERLRAALSSPPPRPDRTEESPR